MKLTWDLLEKASNNANHCQRNWDRTKVISNKERDTLIKVATNMPTKQNRAYYHLLVSDNMDVNREIYKRAFDNKNIWGTDQRNSQVDSHLLFIYVKNSIRQVEEGMAGSEKNTKTTNLIETHNFNVNLSVGISSGAVALAANEMGMRSGFCCCYDKDMIKSYLKSIGHNLTDAIVTMLGIGYPNTEYKSNVVVKDAENKEDEKILQRVTQHPKLIQYKIL